MEKGDYIIRVGNSSASTKVAGVIEVCEDIQTLKAKNLFALDVALNEIHPDAVKLEEKKKEAAGYQAEKVIFDTTAIAQKTVVYQGMRKEYHTDKTWNSRRYLFCMQRIKRNQEYDTCRWSCRTSLAATF